MNRCTDCGMEFKCGAEESGEGTPCWCMRLPPLPMNADVKADEKADKEGCFCSVCLQRRIEAFQKLKK